MCNQGAIQALFVAACTAFIGACDQQPSMKDEQLFTNSMPEEMATNRSDMSWIELTQGQFDRTTIESAGSELATNLKWMELELQAYWELGARFWAEHSDDDRRYKWFVAASMMKPSFPEDLDQWARFEAELGANPAPTDRRKNRQWEQQFAKIENEFRLSKEPSRELRLLLGFSELERVFRAHREKRLLGDPGMPNLLVAEIIDFLTEFEQQSLPQEELEYSLMVQPFLVALLLTDFSGQDCDFVTSSAKSIRDVDNPFSNKFIDDVFIESGCTQRPSALSSYPPTDPTQIQHLFRPSTLPGDVGRWVHTQRMILFDWKVRYGGKQLVSPQIDPNTALRWLAIVNWNPSYYAYADVIATIHEGGFPPTVRVRAEAIEAWKDYYQATRDATLVKAGVDIDMIATLKMTEIWLLISENLALRVRESNSVFDENIVSEFRAFLARDDFAEALRDRHVVFLIQTLSNRYFDLGLSSTEFVEILTSLKIGESNSVVSAIDSTLASLPGSDLRFELEAELLSGEPFSISDYRGRVVFVDHWSTNCSSCISSMPEKHDAYLKFRGEGFEYISVAYDATSNRNRVERIVDSMALSWPTVNAESVREEVMTKYNFSGYPQYMILNENGEIVAGTSEIRSLGYEESIRRALPKSGH